MRILDAGPHHDAGGLPVKVAGTGCSSHLHEFADAKLSGVLNFRENSLVHAAARPTIERHGIHAIDRDALLRGERKDLVHALVAARAHAQARHAFRAQRLQHRVYAVDLHAAAKAIARSRALRILTSPLSLPNCAPRSIAGTARSSSGPPLSPVNATRIG